MLEHIRSQQRGHDIWPQDVTGPHMMMNLLKQRWDAYAKTIAVEPPIRCALCCSKATVDNFLKQK